MRATQQATIRETVTPSAFPSATAPLERDQTPSKAYFRRDCAGKCPGIFFDLRDFAKALHNEMC
jgi:hypothetical protein